MTELATGRGPDGPAIDLIAESPQITEGGVVTLRVDSNVDGTIDWRVEAGHIIEREQERGPVVHWDTSGLRPGIYTATATITPTGATGGSDGPKGPIKATVMVTVRPRPLSPGDPISVALRRTDVPITDDQAFWVAIRNHSESVDFNEYANFIDPILCGEGLTGAIGAHVSGRRFLPYPDLDAYRLLKVATEVFLMTRVGVYTDPNRRFDIPEPDVDQRRLGGQFPTDPNEFRDTIAGLWESYTELTGDRIGGTRIRTLPYLAVIRRKFPELPVVGDDDDGLFDKFGNRCLGILRHKLTNPPLIELIWSYWHEEAMLVQTINAISRRFQNVRGTGLRDPLADLAIDSLRPLNNLLWGYIQDEDHRLTVLRRAYEYDHHYGLRMVGKALPDLRPAESRSRFLEAFHTLLNLTYVFFKEDDDTTVIADAFPILNALREVHLLLTEGQHNQYGDLPWTARQEMLMQQWLLARPEMREFLPGRAMIAYPEPWMERVDGMKRLQSWTDTSVVHFRDLAVFGERILLAIRFGDWINIIDQAQAANWARYWRPEIQGYIHAYRAATGVDLTLDQVDATMPSVLLLQRLAELAGRPAEARRSFRYATASPPAMRGRSAPQLTQGMPISPAELESRPATPERRP